MFNLSNEKDSWKIADLLRSSGKMLTTGNLFDFAKTNKLDLNFDDIEEIIARKNALIFTPNFITDFIISFLKKKELKMKKN